MKKKKREKKKRALHRIEPGSTDTKGYRPIRLQLILRDIGRYAYNSEGVSGRYAKRAWGEH